MSELAAIVLAAGKSTRIKSERAKVLHELCGRPMLDYVLDAVRAAGADRVLVVVGFGASEVRAAYAGQPGLEFVQQAEQLGTGHATQVCRESFKAHDGPVLVIAGDSALVRGESLVRLREIFDRERPACLVATGVLDDPTGFGRIVRGPQGEFLRIVEHKDATDAERQIREINPSCYLFNGRDLFEALDEVRPQNVQKEYYLTDCVAILRDGGKKVMASAVLGGDEALGINSRVDLAAAERVLQERIHERWMLEGVTITDPQSTYIDARAKIGRDTVILPSTVIGGPVEIGAGCRIGPFAYLHGNLRLPDASVVGPFQELGSPSS